MAVPLARAARGGKRSGQKEAAREPRAAAARRSSQMPGTPGSPRESRGEKTLLGPEVPGRETWPQSGLAFRTLLSLHRFIVAPQCTHLPQCMQCKAMRV